MKQRILTQAIIILIALFTTTISLHGQVTMGSNQPPVAGALLDLKQDGATTKGLAMPRVTLTDKDKLYPMLATGYNTAEDAKHVGLIVYHNDKCTMSGKGLYVWTGSEWNKIGDDTPAGLNFNQEYFDLPSGHDARPLTAQNLEITWNGGMAPTWTAAASGGLTAVGFTGTPLAPNPLVNSPETMVLLPDAMSVNPSSPWASKQTDLTFTYTECGQTKTVTLNQTNYALKVNNSFTNTQIVYTTTASGTILVQGNAAWKTTITGTSGLASVSPATGGTDLKNGTSSTTNTTYNAGTGGRYDIANITYSDTQTEKRFNDITVSVVNCGTTADNEPSMLQWAQRAGFTAAEIASVPTGGTHAKTQPNGIQLHRDQSGNIFLSGDFGTDAGSLDGRNRWMLNNLAATSFATGARTGTDVNVSVNLPASPSASVDNYKNPLWTYPNISGNGTSATLYNNNPRLGRLYNWAAATNSKGSTFDNGANDAAYANGQKPYSDGEIAPATDPQTARRQGICPNGWHLPSDYEWTQLEQEINTHTSQYAAIPDANGTITVGQAANRGSTHGQGMKDVCPAPTSSIASNGASNIINDTTMRPGFSAMSAGHASGGVVGNYGGFANFWSASGVGATNVWHRHISSGNAQMNRITNARYSFESVRCKKD